MESHIIAITNCNKQKNKIQNQRWVGFFDDEICHAIVSAICTLISHKVQSCHVSHIWLSFLLMLFFILNEWCSKIAMINDAFCPGKFPLIPF